MTSSADGAACAKSIAERATQTSINLTAAQTTSIGNCIFIDLSLPILQWGAPAVTATGMHCNGYRMLLGAQNPKCNDLGFSV
jgi:hypothetical protein